MLSVAGVYNRLFIWMRRSTSDNVPRYWLFDRRCAIMRACRQNFCYLWRFGRVISMVLALYCGENQDQIRLRYVIVKKGDLLFRFVCAIGFGYSLK